MFDDDDTLEYEPAQTAAIILTGGDEEAEMAAMEVRLDSTGRAGLMGQSSLADAALSSFNPGVVRAVMDEMYSSRASNGVCVF